MAVRTTGLGGAQFVDGEICYDYDMDDTFNAVTALISRDKWIPAYYDASAAASYGLVCFSSSTWIISDAAGVGRRTTNSGSSWSTATGTVNKQLVPCKGTATTAFSYSSSSIAMSYTTNSGANWTNGSLATAATAIYCASFPTSGVLVIGTNTGAARTIYYSTDQGASWTLCSTGPTTSTLSISMWSATVGYAVDNSDNIWKTTDGGVNWTDTTFNVNSNSTSTGENSTLQAISSTVVLYASGRNGQVQRYIDATSVTEVFTGARGDAAAGRVSNFLVTTAGYIYLLTVGLDAGQDTGRAELMRSKDLGLTWQVRSVPANRTTSSQWPQTLLAEYTTNKMLILDSNSSSRGVLLQIDESLE